MHALTRSHIRRLIDTCLGIFHFKAVKVFETFSVCKQLCLYPVLPLPLHTSGILVGLWLDLPKHRRWSEDLAQFLLCKAITQYFYTHVGQNMACLASHSAVGYGEGKSLAAVIGLYSMVLPQPLGKKKEDCTATGVPRNVLAHRKPTGYPFGEPT